MFDLKEFQSKLKSELDQMEELRLYNAKQVEEVTALGEIFLSQIKDSGLIPNAELVPLINGFRIIHQADGDTVLEVRINDMLWEESPWRIQYTKLKPEMSSFSVSGDYNIKLDKIPSTLIKVATDWKHSYYYQT
jgi:hypothetical protein